MTEDEVVDLIKAAQGDQSIRSYARELGVTAAYISDIYRGRRSPGEKILQYFKIGKERRTTVSYMFFKMK